MKKISDICGHEVDFNGIEHPLVSPFSLQYLQKKRESAEVLVIKQGQYPFITALPDYEHQSVYEVNQNEESLPTISDKCKAPVLTIKKWIDCVDDEDKGFSFPYAS